MLPDRAQNGIGKAVDAIDKGRPDSNGWSFAPAHGRELPKQTRTRPGGLTARERRGSRSREGVCGVTCRAGIDGASGEGPRRKRVEASLCSRVLASRPKRADVLPCCPCGSVRRRRFARSCGRDRRHCGGNHLRGAGGDLLSRSRSPDRARPLGNRDFTACVGSTSAAAFTPRVSAELAPRKSTCGCSPGWRFRLARCDAPCRDGFPVGNGP